MPSRTPKSVSKPAMLAAGLAAPGSKVTAWLQSVQASIGANYLRQLFRNGTKVWEAQCAGLLPISGSTIALPTTAVQLSIAAAAIASGVWEHRVVNATDAGQYIATDVTPTTGAGPATLSSDLTAGGTVSLGTFVFGAPPIESVTLTGLAASGVTSSSLTVSVVVGGAIPAGALVLLQVTSQPLTGPWLESPVPTNASLGTYSYTFTGLSANTTYYYRAFLYRNVGPQTQIDAQSTTLTQATPPTSSTAVIDDMVAQMSANPANAAPILLPPGAGWSGGGSIVKGGDLRSIAVPSWWSGNTYASQYTYWDSLLPWYEVWDRSGHQDALNARVAIPWLELWAYYNDTSAWTRVAREVGPTGGSFYQRSGGGTQAGTTRTESNGAFSVTVVPAQMMWHGWGAGASVRAANVVAIQVRMGVQLILADPNGTDDRALARYAAHVGCDGYPPGIYDLGSYNPGMGCSRWEIPPNDLKVLYFTTLARSPNGPTWSVDASYAYNSQQTVTEAWLRANPPPVT